MVLDTSATLAVVLGEDDAEVFLAAMLAAEELLVPAAILTEALIVVEARGGPEATQALRLLIESQRAVVAPVDEALAEGAAAAWRRFGQGRHPAGLNFGDCFSYALARAQDDELLFKGRDFSRTDVKAAIRA